MRQKSGIRVPEEPMRILELSDKTHKHLLELAESATSEDQYTLTHEMRELLNAAPEIYEVDFINRVTDMFPELDEFDHKTGERAMFKECTEALIRVLPQYLKREPLVVGTYLLKILANPDCAGLIIVQAWELGDRLTKR